LGFGVILLVIIHTDPTEGNPLLRMRK